MVFHMYAAAAGVSFSETVLVTDTGAHCVHGNQVVAGLAPLVIEWLNQEQFAALQPFILLRCDDGSDDAGDLHLNYFANVKELLPGGDEIDLVDHTDNGCIDRTVLVALGKSSRRTGNDNYLFMVTGPDRIDRDGVAALVRPVEIDGLYDQQLLAQ